MHFGMASVPGDVRRTSEAADIGRVARCLSGSIGPRYLLEAVPAGLVVVDLDGRIDFANERALELIGLTLTDVEGRMLDSLISGGIDPIVAEHPAPILLRQADGAQLPVEVRVGTLEGPERFMMVTLRDRRADPEPAVRADAKFRALVEQISAITYTWTWRNEQYFVAYSSPQIESILGYSAEEWKADPTAWYEWVHPDDRSAVIEENKRCETTAEAYTMQYRMVRKDGQIIWVEDSWVVVEHEDHKRRVFQGVVFDITERKLAEREIAFLAHHDKLTGLPNRAAFEETLDMALSRARRHDTWVSVLFLDLDNFKLVNDSLGHHAGDALLVQLADRLRRCIRETDRVARQGGDEFLFLLSDIEGVAGGGVVAAEAVAQRIIEAIRDPFDLNGGAFYVSGSIGISVFPRDGLDSDALLKNADAAMYQAKRSAPGSYVVYTPEGEAPLETLAFLTRLRRAVEQENWVLHYQPVVDLGDGHMRGVEALIRWQEPTGGLVPPGEFIPLAEELGLIEAIGDWVIDEMARQQRTWADEGLDLEMSFNLSPRQLWSPNLAKRILGKLEAARVNPRRVVVEITESTAMTEPDRTQKILAELHAWGFTLAIDDFGTGYSSLARLKHLPVDILKIDQMFVRDVDRDMGLAGMVRAMLQLAQSLDMTPLAEGVETRDEYIFLRANGCRFAQGFYFARPGPPERIPLLAAGGSLIPEDASELR
jgi:diguanylate cyclase (GGDEF)-like protein/PAS domain S-box-containing protein